MWVFVMGHVLGFLRSYIYCTISVSQLVNFAFKLQNSCRLILGYGAHDELTPLRRNRACRFATRPPHLRAAAVGEWGVSAHVYMVASDPI